MPRANSLQPAFNAGELSPLLVARIDFAKYPAGCAFTENLLPLAEGGITRRAGTRFAKEVKDSGALTLIRNFLYDVEQAYAVEWGPQYLRFFRHQGRITVADTDAAITNGTFESGITGWTDRSTGAGAISHDATNQRMNLTPGGSGGSDIAIAEYQVTTSNTGQEHVLRFQVFGVPGDVVQIRVGTGIGDTDILAETQCAVGYHCKAFTPTTSPCYIQIRARGEDQNKTVQIDNVQFLDDQPLELATPYGESDLRACRSDQSGDIQYITHGDHPVYKLERYGHTSWSLVEVAFEDGPYLDRNVTPTTLTPAAATGYGITVTASSTVGINDGQGFLESDVGRSIRIRDNGKWAWGVISSVTSTTVAKVDYRDGVNFPTVLKSAWQLGAWSATTGYPQQIAFFEQRAVYGPTRSARGRVWFTQSADLENMTPDNRDADNDATVEADDAFDYVLPTANTILWIKAGRQLALGTLAQEWIADSDGPVLTYDDIQIRPHTSVASAAIDPVLVDNVVLFASRGKRRLHEFAYVFESDGYRAPDMTLLARQITRGKIVEMAFQEEEDTVVWAPRGDGLLLSLTYKREQDVVGWGRHRLGGAYQGSNPVVESVTTIPGDDGPGQVADSTERNEVWMVVKRTINGTTKRYIEFFEGRFEGPTLEDYDDDEDAWKAATIAAQKHCYFADSLLTYDGAATDAISGLDHLEGETVTVLADGAVHPARVVEDGAIALDYAASVVQVGLPYTHKWKSLKNPAGAAAGTGIGKIGKIHAVALVLHETTTFDLGPSFADMSTVAFRKMGDLMDTAVPLFTGEYYDEIEGGYSRDSRLCIRGSAPGPFTLLATAPELEKNEMV